MVDSAVLAGADLLRDMPDEALAMIADAAIERRLTRGDVLFTETDPPQQMYVVTSGRIAITKAAADGRESVIALMESGDLFGEMAMFDDLGRSADARALEPSTVVEIPFGPVRRVFDEQPDLLWRVVSLLVRRLRVLDGTLADNMFLDVTGRTAKRLLELAGADEEFTLPVTQEELAGMIGASRERVNKAISSFIRLGWLEQNDRRYRILDRRQLTIRAN